MTDLYLKSHTPKDNEATAVRQAGTLSELLRVEVHSDGSASIVELSHKPLQPGQVPYAPSAGTKTLVGYIDLTPTWSEMLPSMLAVFADGDGQGRVKAVQELTRMAVLADLYVAGQQKAQADAKN